MTRSQVQGAADEVAGYAATYSQLSATAEQVKDWQAVDMYDDASAAARRIASELTDLAELVGRIEAYCATPIGPDSKIHL